MKKLLSSAIVSLILVPFALSSQAVALENNENGRSLLDAVAHEGNPQDLAASPSQILAQANPAQQVQSLFEEAQQLTAEEKYQQAEQKYQQILNIVTQATSADNPELAQVHFSLGVLDHKQQKLSAAKADYENAVKVNPEYIPAIINLGLLAYEEGQLDKAIQYWQSAIKINNDESVAEAQLALAVMLYHKRKQEQAFELAKRALGENIELADLSNLKQSLWGDKLLENTKILLAENHIKVFVANFKKATQLDRQATKLYDAGKYFDAEPLYVKALEIRERLFKGDHLDVATSLNNLAYHYFLTGKHNESEALYIKALDMRRRLYSKDHLTVANSLNNLAWFYRTTGKPNQSEAFYIEALEMNKRLYPNKVHPVMASTLVGLGMLYHEQAKFIEAKSLFIEALEIKRRLYSDNHEDVPFILSKLGELCREQGEYGEAEAFLSEALSIRKRIYSENNRYVVFSLTDLARLYEAQGRYSKAEIFGNKALKKIKLLYTEDSFFTVNIMSTLGNIYQAQGKYEKAEPLFTEALAMNQRLNPRDNPYLLNSLSSLAQVYQAQEKYLEAESLFTRALAMSKQIYVEVHPDKATSLVNLAEFYRNQKRYKEAKTLYEESLMMFEKLYNRHHPNVATVLNNTAVFYQAQEKYQQALYYLAQGSKVEETIITKNLLIGSERQRRQFLELFKGSSSLTISLHLQDIPENIEAAQLALTTVLRRKGRVLDAMGRTLKILRDNQDSASERLFIQLVSTQTQLANLSARPLPDDSTQRANIQAQQAELDNQIKQLETQLSSRSAEFQQETTPVTIEAVQQAIPNNAALVEFIQYRPFDAKESTYSEPRYAVYVLLPNGQMQWQDLGEASVIDDKIQRFRTLLGNGGERGLGAVQAESGINATKDVARELDEMLVQPVRGMVGNATHLLLSPDSQLNTLPFAALVDEQDKYLVENYLLTYLTSGRDLLRLQLNQNQDTTQPLLLANPTYSSPGVATKSNTKEEDNTRGRRSGELGKLEFTTLPGTKVEGEAIAELVPNLKVFTQQQASENNLKQTKNPEFLHLATHGFFLPPQEEELNDNRNGTLSLDDRTPVFSTAENPLLRSGLALAGFNQRDSGTEDGVLTALEVTGLNLRGTKLVVMSACETGLGDVQAGEGVYGLRRAFTLAGAQSQLMSLWSVDDDGTKDLMVNYYTKIQNGEGRGEALRQVQLEMLESEDRKHPFYWAAFIPSGSWLPLDSSN